MWGGRGGGVRKSIWGRGGMGWGGEGGGGGLGVKNKFVLKCFLDDFKAFFFSFFFLVENQPIADPPLPFSGKFN